MKLLLELILFHIEMNWTASQKYPSLSTSETNFCEDLVPIIVNMCKSLGASTNVLLMSKYSQRTIELNRSLNRKIHMKWNCSSTLQTTSLIFMGTNSDRWLKIHVPHIPLLSVWWCSGTIQDQVGESLLCPESPAQSVLWNRSLCPTQWLVFSNRRLWSNSPNIRFIICLNLSSQCPCSSFSAFHTHCSDPFPSRSLQAPISFL